MASSEDSILAGLTTELQRDPSVLIVEDDQDVAVTIRRFLDRSGMKTEWARTGAEAIALKESFKPDIVLVDLTLPDIDGSKLITYLSAKKDCGIIIVSGRSEEVERIVGIELGADDYVTKPPSFRELVARIRAVHRRAVRTAAPAAVAPPVETGVIALGPVRIDLKRRVINSQNPAEGSDGQIRLTSAEFVALEALIEAAPNPVSRESLCQKALRRPFHAEDRGVDQLILNLRRKLFENENGHDFIVSIRGAGYAIPTDRALLVVRE